MTDAQFETLAGLLAEIRDRLDYLCQPAEADEPTCAHDEARRTDFSTPRETHWICGDCGHVVQQRRSITAPASPPSASAEE